MVGMSSTDPRTTLADILAAVDSLKPPEPAGYAVHPADVGVGHPEPLTAAEIRRRRER